MRSVAKLGLLAAGLVLTLAAATSRAADAYDVDGAHSQVVFKVKHLGVSNNYGRFNGIKGSYVFDAAAPAASSFDLTIDADSVDTANAKRDQHLKSPDFFNSKQFPVIGFKSKSLTKKSDGLFEATGTLTFHGVTKDLTVEIRHVGMGADPWGGTRSGFESQFTIKRSDFGVNYMPEGLGDEVTVFVNIEGVKKK